MHGVEGVNATETELLDRVQTLDCKEAVEKDLRKSGGTSLHPVAPNEPGSNGGNGNFNSCSAKRTHESDVSFNLKNPN